MIWNPFKIVPKSFLGVDIGTFSIKIVELSRRAGKIKLENYGEIQAEALYERPFRTFEKSTLTVSSQDVSRAIRAILEEARIKTNQSNFSIPDFSTFFTTLSLPPMTREELPQAVEYEARQYIPIPISEVTLDWQVIGGEGIRNNSTPFQILLVAVPNEVINQYKEIAENSGLELVALEAEVFGLSRAVTENHNSFALVDIGARSTTISIIEKGILKISHSFDTSGNDLTDVIAKGLEVDYGKAEELKQKYGILPSEINGRESMLPLIDLILKEIEKIFQNFYQTEGKEIQKIILSGGSALLPGLIDYFSKNLKKPTEIANPFANIYYSPVLEETIKQIGPSYAIAVGEALRGLQ